MRRVTVALVTIPLLLAVALAPAWSQSEDPKALIGEWNGEWKFSSGQPPLQDVYTLTIARVRGKHVLGHVEASTPRGLQKFKIQGVLEGKTLSFARTSLEIDGSQMVGHDTQRGWDITLTKTK